MLRWIDNDTLVEMRDAVIIDNDDEDTAKILAMDYAIERRMDGRMSFSIVRLI